MACFSVLFLAFFFLFLSLGLALGMGCYRVLRKLFLIEKEFSKLLNLLAEENQQIQNRIIERQIYSHQIVTKNQDGY